MLGWGVLFQSGSKIVLGQGYDIKIKRSWLVNISKNTLEWPFLVVRPVCGLSLKENVSCTFELYDKHEDVENVHSCL